MSSLRNALPRRAHKERAQPQARRKYGILEKHKDYVERAKAYHKKEQTLQKLKEKAAFRNPDEFYFKMSRTKIVNGVHRPESQANIYTPEKLLLLKTQDAGYILQAMQSERSKLERLAGALHSLDNRPSRGHVYYAADREEAKELQLRTSSDTPVSASDNLPDRIKRAMASSYKLLERSKLRVRDLEESYMKMAMEKELQKKGRKRKLRGDELSPADKKPPADEPPADKPVFKWRPERKR